MGLLRPCAPRVGLSILYSEATCMEWVLVLGSLEGMVG